MRNSRRFCAAICGFVVLLASTNSNACPDGQYKFNLGFKSICLPKGPPPPPPPPPPVKLPDQRTLLRIVINPTSYINPTGIPTEGDFMQQVMENPQATIQLLENPGQFPYFPVAEAMISAHNAILNNGAKPIPDDIRRFLRIWYPDDVLASIRFTTNYNAVQNLLPAAQMTFNPRTRAVTLLNTIAFRDDADANDASIWAHEVYHVMQYKKWGVFGFAKHWVDNSSVGGPVEAPAYDRQDEAADLWDRGIRGPTGAQQTASGLWPANAQLTPCECAPVTAQIIPEPRCQTKAVMHSLCGGICPNPSDTPQMWACAPLPPGQPGTGGDIQ